MLPMKRLLFPLIFVSIAGCQPKAEQLEPEDALAPDASVLADVSFEQARDVIWEKELAVYEGRSRGDISIYVSNTADGYSAWPPFSPTPYGRETLQANGGGTNGGTQEQLAMDLVSFTLNGESAIIYYKTHMTRAADGTQVDYRYEVTHTWVVEDGDWKVLGGMARAMPDRED